MTITEDDVARADSGSPLVSARGLSALADRAELRYREEIEQYPSPLEDIPRFIDDKELPRKLTFALRRSGIAPRGELVELGAGTCWLSAELAKLPAVHRIRAVEFSERRIARLAPIAMAHLGAPAEKIERHVADFYDHGLEPAEADLVFMDAAFHHARDPERLARVAWELLKPGGSFVLFREPTVAALRRGRDHGEEGRHGSFEREYTPGEYLELLRAAGFDPHRHAAAGGWRTARARATLVPPLSWLNGILFAEFTYVGYRPSAA